MEKFIQMFKKNSFRMYCQQNLWECDRPTLRPTTPLKKMPD